MRLRYGTFSGDAWLAAVPVLQILCLLGIYLSIESMQEAFCIALGRAGWLVLLASLEAALCIGAMVHLVQPGLIAVTVTFTAVFLTVWPLRLLLVTKVAGIRMRDYLGVFVLPLALAVATAAAVETWQRLSAQRMSTLSLLLSSILIGVVVYIPGVWLTMRRRIQDLISSLRSMRETVADGADNR